MMEEESNSKLCVLCCQLLSSSSTTTSTPPGDQQKQDDLRPRASDRVDFESISKVLLELPDEKGYDHEIVTSFETFETLSVCRECHLLITAGMEFQRQRGLVEAVVANLQLEILEQLRKLQSFANDYHMEMKKIEGVILGSDVATLKNFLVKHSRAPGDRVKSKGVMKFRGKFLAVAEQLEFYQRLISPKVDCASEYELGEDGTFRPAPKPKKRKSSTKPSLPLPAKEENIVEDEQVDTDPVTFDDDEPYEEMTEMEPDVEFYSDDAEFEFADDDEFGSDYLPSDGEELSMEHPIPVEKKREIAKAKRKEYKKQTHQKKRDDRIKRIEEATQGMAGFKREIVSRIWRRLEGPLQKKKSKRILPGTLANGIADPRRNFEIDFNLERNTLTVGDIDILINEDEQFLECSVCSFRVSLNEQERLRGPLERVMANHVFGKHLDIYTCTICFSTFQSFRRYHDHLKNHQNPISCDICGKPMSGKGAMATHKWSHMSPDEVAAAIASGVKDPRERIARAKAKALLTNLCKFCGKSFATVTFLRIHEDTHLPPEERERVVCPTCGKALLLNSLNSKTHLKFCKPSESAQDRLMCPRCPNTYKNQIVLKRHMARDHNGVLAGSGEEKPFQCSTCEKTFKDRNNLRLHELTHSDARPFACSKCSANFKMKKHCTRHEKKCEGQTSRGKKIPQAPALVATRTLQILESVPKVETETIITIAF